MEGLTISLYLGQKESIIRQAGLHKINRYWLKIERCGLLNKVDKWSSASLEERFT